MKFFSLFMTFLFCRLALAQVPVPAQAKPEITAPSAVTTETQLPVPEKGSGAEKPATAPSSIPAFVPAPAPVSAADASKDIPAEPDSSAKNTNVTFTLENSLNLRDPFRQFVSKVDGGGDDGIPELERYDLAKYELVGVITGPKKSKALVVAAGGNKMNIVTAGMKIGSRGGIIKRIAPGMITVEEKTVNLLGQEENIETAIEIKKEVRSSDDKAGFSTGVNAVPGNAVPGMRPQGT